LLGADGIFCDELSGIFDSNEDRSEEMAHIMEITSLYTINLP
jgi:pyridoxal biosynthesis lyase PdxS